VKKRLAAAVLLSGFTAMAAAPVAIRVDVEPVRDSGDRTTMAITVQVAPEDRSKIGTDAWIQGELRQRGERVDRLARAVNLDEGGQARIEANWPPGEYELQIEIEGAKRRGTGVWIQKITVPDMQNTAVESQPDLEIASATVAAAATAAAEDPAPPTAEEQSVSAVEPPESEPQETNQGIEPSPEDKVATAAAGAVAVGAAATQSTEPEPPEIELTPEPESTVTAVEPGSEDRSEDAPVVAATGDAAATATADKSTLPTTGEEQPLATAELSESPPQETEHESEEAPASTIAATAAGAVAVGAAATQPAEPEPSEVETMPEPEAPTPESPDDPTETIAAASTATAAAATVESGTQSPSTDPRIEEPTAAPEPPPASTHLSSKWPTPAGSTDLTVMVTERNRPIVGLGKTSFGLKIAGNDVAIDHIGEGAEVPLNLGFAVGVSQSSLESLDNVVRQIERLALRTADGKGEVFLAVTGAEPSIVEPWTTNPEKISRALESAAPPGQTSLSRILRDSAQTFDGRRGRSVLIIISDGSDDSSKADWKEATSAATSAGIPVFVIGLSDSGFPSRTRSSLVKLAAASGGRSYFLANDSMLQLTLDYVGELVDTSYVIQFVTQPGGGPVKVESGNRAWEVHHPSRIP